MILFGTVRQGQRIALWDRQGRVELVDGPRRLCLWNQTVQELPHYNASADEYLMIDFKDGHREHVLGPAAMWLDPVEHERVRVEKALRIEANDTIVVYTRGDAHVERRVLRGPAVYVPAVNEWTARELAHYSAAAEEYLAIDFRDGHSEHIRGPSDIWFDPVIHEEVRVEKALPIDANEAIVIYARNNGYVERRILRGPAMYVLAENEWLHEFRWHGSDPKDPRRKIPRALQFTKLRVIPDQTYLDVEEVRTADDALVVIKLMLFFELTDIEVMLDQTHDPTADFYNAVSADVIDFAAGLSFEDFKRQTERLNDLATYLQLTQRAARIGYRINKVVYRGYEAGAKLQTMHDDAIEIRTQLKLEAETERQAQELADLKLQREAQRAIETRRMQQEQAEHEQRLQRLAHEEHLRQADAEQRQRMEAERLSNQLELEQVRAKNAERTTFLQSMQALQVDLTRYLTAKYQNPDRLIRIDGDGRARVHLHAQ